MADKGPWPIRTPFLAHDVFNRSSDYTHNTLAPSRDASLVAKYGRRPDNTRAYAEIATQPVALAVQSLSPRSIGKGA